MRAKRREWRGRAATRRSKLSSIRACPGAGPGTRKPPAISDNVRSCGNSTSASGLPPVSTMSRSSTCSSRGARRTESRSARASRCPSGSTWTSGRPRSASPNLPGAEHDRDPLGREAASRKPEDLCGRAIEPLGVIDQAEEAARSRRLGEESENRERDEEPVGNWPAAEPERDVERLALRERQTLPKIQDRRTELLDSGKRELHLAFDPCGTDNSHGRGPLHRVVEERRLADSGLAVDDERAAVAVACGLHQPVQGRSLAFPAEQLHPGLPPSHSTRAPSSFPKDDTGVANYGHSGCDCPGDDSKIRRISRTRKGNAP
jgi:hypothetical protein